MQTRDEVEGVHNFQEFSQPLECLYRAFQTQEKVFYCFYKITLVLSKIVKSQLCLHTLMQTHLSANQSVRSILAIL